MAYTVIKLLLTISWLIWVEPVISQIIDLENSLVACYPFSNNADDVSGNLNHGIVIGPVLTSDRYGNINSAYYFDGVNDYIVVEDADILSFPAQKFSIALWIKPTSLDHSFILYKGSNRNNREYAIGIRPDALLSIQINNNGDASAQYGTASNTIPDISEWYHVVGTWDGLHLSIYINGQLENRTDHNVMIGNFDSNLFFGGYGGSIEEYAYQGAIDDIFLYSRVINECEINALYSGELLEER